MKATPRRYLSEVSQVTHQRACHGLAVLLLMAAVAPAWGQSQIVSRTVLQPTPEDRALSDPEVSVNFGEAVAVEGRFAAVGIPFEIMEDGDGPGRVGIYTKMSAGWTRTATLLPTDPSDIRFGRDVELCGNLAIVAAEDSIYVFERSGWVWRKLKRIVPPSPRRVHGAIACSDGSFAVSIATLGLPEDRVHVYKRCGNDFRQVAWLRASDPNDKIGRSLAMERSVLVAGSYPDGAYVFVRQGHRWIEREKLLGAGPADASIGSAVAIRDRIIIAGAPGVDFPPCEIDNCDAEGDAFAYLPSQGSWFQSQSLNNPPRYVVWEFGSQVAMGRGLAAILAPRIGQGLVISSAVFVFDRIGAEFTLGRAVFGTSATSESRVKDIDMSGRRLIASVHELRFFPSTRIVGSAEIIEFEESFDPMTQTDREEAAAGSQ